MLIMRDWYVAWICSSVFELLELTFRYWLPNFYECWWDTLILDLFGCNLIGIILGHYTLKWFGVSKISWVKSTIPKDQCCDPEVVLRVIDKLRPQVLERFEWSALQNLSRYIGVATFCCVTLIIDCNNFFYKYLAWIPADHLLVKYRVLLWGFVAIATSKEWYEYVSNPVCHRLGPFVWLTLYTCAIESLSVYKFRGDEFQNPFPWWIKAIWALIAVMFTIGAFKAYRNGKKQRQAIFNPYNPSIDIVY